MSKLKSKFIQKVTMDCTRERYEKFLKKDLIKMGYSDLYMDFEPGMFYGNIITNNLSGNLGDLAIIPKLTEMDPESVHISFNPKLFLAIAAMTNLAYGSYGEHVTCIKDAVMSGTNHVEYINGVIYRIEKRDCITDESGDFTHSWSNGLRFEYFRKTTLIELIAEFLHKEPKVIKDEKDTSNPTFEKRLTDIETTLKTILAAQKSTELIIPNPKFQVGQWVKATNGKVFPINMINKDCAPLYLYRRDVVNNSDLCLVESYAEADLEKWNPEVGDYYVYGRNNLNFIIIKNGENSFKTVHTELACIVVDGKNVSGITFDGSTNKLINVRPATQEEIKLLNEELTKIGKKFDKETCTLINIIKPLVVGKPAIFWNKRPEAAMIGIYSEKSHKGNYYPLDTLHAYDNAIYCESLEQYESFIKG